MTRPVRGFITLVLLLVVAGLGYVSYYELTLPDRLEAELHRLNCEMAQRVALAQSDPTKARLMVLSAQVVCQR